MMFADMKVGTRLHVLAADEMHVLTEAQGAAATEMA
jgi:hypothetical protein